MSILIKGMEMPRHCGECGIEWCERWKKLIIAGMSIAKERPSDCPLIEIPPHGRLIDADALIKDHGMLLQRDGGYMPIVYLSYVSNAPTIIPAEEAET